MLVRPIITYRGSPEQKLKKLPECIAKALERAVLAWHHGRDPDFKAQTAGFLPFHFTGQAYYRYGSVYRRRTAKYQARKLHKYGHNHPLEWSGTTRTCVTRAVRVSVRGKTASGTMSGANRALNFHSGQGKHDLRAELLAVNAAEAKALAAGVEAIIAAELNKDEPATNVA